jgi:hypothetical protein
MAYICEYINISGQKKYLTVWADSINEASWKAGRLTRDKYVLHTVTQRD